MTRQCHINVTNYTHLKFEHLDNLVIACHKIWTINKKIYKKIKIHIWLMAHDNEFT
jgi:hypothetical protein